MAEPKLPMKVFLHKIRHFLYHIFSLTSQILFYLIYLGIFVIYMAFEIEHKYLVCNDSYRELAKQKHFIRQGYLSRDKNRTVRVRTKDDTAYLTIKTRNIGDTRCEYEYEIPFSDALPLLEACIPPVIEKTRYLVDFSGHTWEIDEFDGFLSGIRIAEIELSNSDEEYALPPFAGKNVTGDAKYYNSNIHLLAKPLNEGQG